MSPTKTDKKKAARKANEEPYARYGRDWEKQAMKLTKAALVDLWRSAIIDNHAAHKRHQEDTIAQIEADRQRLMRIEGFFGQEGPIHEIHHRLDLLLHVNELAQELDAKKEEQGKWNPAIGEYVVYPTGMVGKIVDLIGSSSGHKALVDTPVGHREWRYDSIRKATQAEIDEEIESSAYGEREGLEEGDRCEASAEQWEELIAIAIPDGLTDWTKAPKNITLMPTWEGGMLKATLFIKQIIPFPVFKKLLIKTVEKLRAAREEEEAKKPAPIGTPVMFEGDRWVVACERPTRSGLYCLSRSSDGGMSITPPNVTRDRFTVLNN